MVPSYISPPRLGWRGGEGVGQVMSCIPEGYRIALFSYLEMEGPQRRPAQTFGCSDPDFAVLVVLRCGIDLTQGLN